MASVMMQPQVRYRNGQVNLGDNHAEMAVDCPPSFVRAHPPHGTGSPHLETPPPTPATGFQEYGSTDKNLEAVAAAAASLPQPEMDTSRIRRMRESMKRKKELARRDERVRQDMAREDIADKLRQMKDMTADEEAAARMRGVHNLGYEEDSFTESEDEVPEPPISMEAIFTALHEISRESGDPTMSENLNFVRNIMTNDAFQNSVELHDVVKRKTMANTSYPPLSRDSTLLMKEIDEDLVMSKDSSARELSGLFARHHFKALLQAHDGVAEFAHVPTPHYDNAPLDSVNGEDKVLLHNAAKYTTKPAKIVTVNKTNAPLGATVRVEEEGNVIISRLVVGGAAEKSGLLHEGDEILEVNGQTMRGLDVNEVGDAIGAMAGILKFLIIPVEGSVTQNGVHAFDFNKEPVMHVRALFDYDAFDDMYLPCRELGLSFMKGDILHIMSQEDRDWWQAYREGDADQHTLPGLIPAQEFKHQLEAIRISLGKKDVEPEQKSSLMCGRSRKKKKKGKKKETVTEGDDSADEIEVYEEMALYHQPESEKRPIVLIAQPNVGRHELRQRLVENDRDRFAFAVPHTTRAKNDGESNGEDYHFVSMNEFESMIASDQFLEHGSFQKNLYGTTIDAVQKVINSGKICILNLHAESLKRLKTTSLKPYIIFIAPPTLERLRQNASKEGKQMKDDELKKIIENARIIETKYAHYFDEVIRNTDLSRSYAELLRHINKLDTEPQWVPVAWLH